MAGFTTNQWIVLALFLLLGWFLGLLTTSSGRKWRRAFENERALRIKADAESDRLSALVAGLERERERRVVVEKERDRSAIKADTAGSIAAAASGQRDDLARIFGVGRAGEIRLNEAGIHRYAEIISLSQTAEAKLEGQLDLSPGTIAEERWREQANILRKGQFDEHARLFA